MMLWNLGILWYHILASFYMFSFMHDLKHFTFAFCCFCSVFHFYIISCHFFWCPSFDDWKLSSPGRAKYDNKNNSYLGGELLLRKIQHLHNLSPKLKRTDIADYWKIDSTCLSACTSSFQRRLDWLHGEVVTKATKCYHSSSLSKYGRGSTSSVGIFASQVHNICKVSLVRS